MTVSLLPDEDESNWEWSRTFSNSGDSVLEVASIDSEYGDVALIVRCTITSTNQELEAYIVWDSLLRDVDSLPVKTAFDQEPINEIAWGVGTSYESTFHLNPEMLVERLRSSETLIAGVWSRNDEHMSAGFRTKNPDEAFENLRCLS